MKSFIKTTSNIYNLKQVERIMHISKYIIEIQIHLEFYMVIFY
jgi:hypothetical protein